MESHKEASVSPLSQEHNWKLSAERGRKRSPLTGRVSGPLKKMRTVWHGQMESPESLQEIPVSGLWVSGGATIDYKEGQDNTPGEQKRTGP